MSDVKTDGENPPEENACDEGDFGPDGYLTCLHPEGSFSNIRVEGRVLVRPDIHYAKAAIHVLAALLVASILCLWDFRVAGLLLGVYTAIRMRSILIGLILLYQRYAPADVRLACLFEPSCSEYMILSIKKFGVIYGCAKGINRLSRCRYPNGGEDYP